jgi:hypothetical protein
MGKIAHSFQAEPVLRHLFLQIFEKPTHDGGNCLGTCPVANRADQFHTLSSAQRGLVSSFFAFQFRNP